MPNINKAVPRPFRARTSHFPKWQPIPSCVLYFNGQQDAKSGVIHDLSGRKHHGTITVATWLKISSGLWVLNFSGANDFIQVPAATSTAMNFTSGSFTLMAWLYIDNVPSSQYVMIQGATNVDGWGFFLFANNISLRLNQGGAHTDISAVNGFTFSKWQLMGVTRTGAGGQFYNNGAAITTELGVGLTDAVSVAGGNKFIMGTDNDEASNEWDGYIGLPKVFNAALTATQMNGIFQCERHLFGV